MKTPGRKRVEEIIDSPCKFHSLVVPFKFGHSNLDIHNICMELTSNGLLFNY